MKIRVSGRVTYTLNIDRTIDTEEEAANLAEYEAMTQEFNPNLSQQDIAVAASRVYMTAVVGNLLNELKGIDVDGCDSAGYDLDAEVVSK